MLTNELDRLTARIQPGDFANGAYRRTIIWEMIDSYNLTDARVKEILGLLNSFNQIETDADRIRVRPRHMIRTTDNMLVLCGATGPSLRELLTQRLGIEFKRLELIDGLELELLFISEDDFNLMDDDLKQLTGMPDPNISSHRLLYSEITQSEWFNNLRWMEVSTLNPLANRPGFQTQQFNIQTQTMRNVEGSNQRLETELVLSGDGAYRSWQLVRKTSSNRFEAVNLNTLDDRRRAKLYVNERAGVNPFHWDSDSRLHLPSHLLLPIKIEISLHIAGMKEIEYGELSIKGERPISSRILSGIDESFMKLFREATLVGDENE